MLRRTLTALFAILLAGGAIVFYLLQDANRFKPQLQALLQEQTGSPVRITGPLTWQLFPPLVLRAQSIEAELAGAQWRVGQLDLDLDVMTVLNDRGVSGWQLQAVGLKDVVQVIDGGRLRIANAELTQFSLGSQAAFSAALDYTPDFEQTVATTIPAKVSGLVTVHGDAQGADLTATTFSTPNAAGTCNMQLVRAQPTRAAPTPTDDDIVSVALLRAVEWLGDCQLTRLMLADRDFHNASVKLKNTAGVARTVMVLPQFLGGKAKVVVVTRAQHLPVRWLIKSTLSGVHSQRLMAWLDQELQWAAPLAYNGSIALTGNTPQALLASIEGETTFDGARGNISITQIKQPLQGLATLLKEPERVSAWPDLWQYEDLTGRWRVNGSNHELALALDNLRVLAKGTYNVTEDQLDMLAELQFVSLHEGAMFDVNPLLMDLPIPLQCNGSVENPSCRLAPDAAQRIMASVLTSGENSALRAKVDTKIEEQVPEQFRDAARDLLDLLGDSLNRDTPR